MDKQGYPSLGNSGTSSQKQHAMAHQSSDISSEDVEAWPKEGGNAAVLSTPSPVAPPASKRDAYEGGGGGLRW